MRRIGLVITNDAKRDLATPGPSNGHARAEADLVGISRWCGDARSLEAGCPVTTLTPKALCLRVLKRLTLIGKATVDCLKGSDDQRMAARGHWIGTRRDRDLGQPFWYLAVGLSDECLVHPIDIARAAGTFNPLHRICSSPSNGRWLVLNGVRWRVVAAPW
ncbi:hypothetical protein [Elioraea sp.]|uniref:hypothetical protein n=1 Tax=Elioraea sp. TaxID=2185103 RepID=UPI0025BA7453|nr:hypothetical protein [Elioraea sp.]